MLDYEKEALPSPTTPATANSASFPLVESNYDAEAARTPSTQDSWRRLLGQPAKLSSRMASTGTLDARQREILSAIEIAKTHTRKLEHCPTGYPRISSFLSSDSSFSLYRGFGYLHSRVLLDLQQNIADLEHELDELDEEDSRTSTGQKRLQIRAYDVRNDRDPELGYRDRRVIINELRIKLLEYDELLIKARDIQAFQKPSHRDYKSVRTWFWNVKPVAQKEADFIKKKEDIITLRSGREWSAFDGLVEATLRKFDCELIRRVFCTQELREKTSDQHIYYYSSSRVEAFVGLIITSIIFVILVLPVVAMYKLTAFGVGPNNANGTFKAIGVLVVFTLLFSAAMSMLTTARRHELFAASAAYCAVLVVFISNFS